MDRSRLVSPVARVPHNGRLNELTLARSPLVAGLSITEGVLRFDRDGAADYAQPFIARP